MAETRPNLIKELIEFIREASAIIHYFSDILVIISVYNIIFEQGAAGSIIIWVIAALIFGVIAELLKSHLPTPLRIILARRSVL